MQKSLRSGNLESNLTSSRYKSKSQHKQNFQCDYSEQRNMTEHLRSIVEDIYTAEEESSQIQAIKKLRLQHSQQIQSLKLQQHLHQSEYQFSLQQYKNKLEEVQYHYDCSLIENQKVKQHCRRNDDELITLRETVRKMQRKIRNQQILIDEYKASTEEQMSLEREVIKNMFQQRELEIKKKFDIALRQMEQNYEKKIRELEHLHVRKDMNVDLKMIKKYCNELGKQKRKYPSRDASEENKQNEHGSLKKLQGISSYSTLAK